MLALVDTHLKKAIQSGKISHVDEMDLLGSVQPASLDLPIGSHLYHLENKFLPFSTTIQERIDKLATDKISTKNGTVLYK